MHTLTFTALHENAQIPSRSHVTDAGLDLATSEQRTLYAGQHSLLPTGLTVLVPEQHYLSITPRSSTLFRHGLIVVPGVVDPGFTGEVKIAVMNVSGATVWLEQGTRVAQVLLVPIVPVTPQMTYKTLLRNSTRGSNGFGSTGA